MKKCWGEARRDSQTATLERSPRRLTSGREDLCAGLVCQCSCPGGAAPRRDPQRSSLLSPLQAVSGNVLQSHKDFHLHHPVWERVEGGSSALLPFSGFSVLSFVRLRSKTQALQVTAQTVSKHALAAPQRCFPPTRPHALGTGVGWGHPGAIRAICDPWVLRSRGGSCSPASASHNHCAANQTPPRSETSPGAIWHL